jgi:hypothetical protein
MRRLMIAVATAVALSACGTAAGSDRQVASLGTGAVDDSTAGSENATATTAPKDPNEAALEFAKCMREHGVDMPDPVVKDDGNGGGGVLIQVGGPNGDKTPPDKQTMDAANKDCQHFLQESAGSFDPPSPEEQEKMKEKALAFAKCMRDHGIDMPDPQFGDDGTFSVSVGAGPDGTGPVTNGPPVDFNSKEFQDANEACGQDGGFGFTTGTVNG